MINSGIEEELIAVDTNPAILLREEKGKVEEFMKNWYLNSEREESNETAYVWEIVNGWEITQLTDMLITKPNKVQETKFTPKKYELISQYIHEDSKGNWQNIVQYISRKEIIVHLQENVFWVNPSSSLPNITAIIVLTSANIVDLLGFLNIAKQGARVITIEPIYRKMKKLIAFLNNNTKEKIKQPQVYLLKAEQYFEYANIIWLARENCWFEPSYNLTLMISHTKQTFLIQDRKLDEAKLIYYGWKKGVISERNYQMYIREWDKSIIKAEEGIKHHIPRLQRKNKKEMKDWYLPFIRKQLIGQLSGVEQNQLFACCEMLDLVPSQIVAKQGYLFDYLFILIQGQFQYSEISAVAASLDKLYGLKELQNRSETYSFTLRSLTHGLLLRIQKNNMLFHLYDLLN